MCLLVRSVLKLIKLTGFSVAAHCFELFIKNNDADNFDSVDYKDDDTSDDEEKEGIDLDIEKIKSSLTIELGRWKTDAKIDCPNEDDDDACLPYITIPVSAVLIHKEYDKNKVKFGVKSVDVIKNDIAIVKLGWSITYTDNIKPVCLPTKDNRFTKVEVSGFGKFIYF